MRSILGAILGTWVSLNFAARSADVPTAPELFARHFVAAGGAGEMEKVHSVRVEGTVREGDSTSEFTLQARWPFQFLLSERDEKGRMSWFGRGDNGRSWIKDRQGTRDVTNGVTGEVGAVCLGLFPGAQIFLSDRLREAVCELDRANGRPAWSVGKRHVPKRGLPRALFDVESGFLAGIGHARFADYREVGRLRLPYRVDQGARRKFVVSRVVFNEEPDEKIFARPGGYRSWVPKGPDARSSGPSSMVTTLSAPGKMGIVRKPEPASGRVRSLSELPEFDPDSGDHAQVSLQTKDLGHLKLGPENLIALQHADFNSRTVWPARLPAGFDPGQIMELGKNPGLGIRKLHARGITGKGVGVATIDFPLLADHVEYADRLRLFEEVESTGSIGAHMHGTAVASIAVGRTCGVAPGADLYHISSLNARTGKNGNLELEFRGIARAIHRLLDVNTNLPPDRRIRVISLSMGWSPGTLGYEQAMGACERARLEKVFVISTSLRSTHALQFDGLNRAATADPDKFESFGPGSWWASMFWNGEMRFKPGTRLCVPMDARTTASPTGSSEYVHYDAAGWSWAVPWVAGLYALACEVAPEITPEAFWTEALATGRNLEIRHGDELIPFGTLADPVALIDRLSQKRTMALRNQAPLCELGL